MIPLDSWGSCFFQTYNELEEQCYMHGRPNNLSEEMKKLFPEAEEDTVHWGKSTYKQHYGQYMIVVNFGKTVANRLLPNRDTRYQGYVYKPTIASWELQEIEGIYSWMTKEEFEKIHTVHDVCRCCGHGHSQYVPLRMGRTSARRSCICADFLRSSPLSLRFISEGEARCGAAPAAAPFMYSFVCAEPAAGIFCLPVSEPWSDVI